jgi:hypothetical protein
VLVAGRKKKKRRDSSDNDDISQVIMAALEELRNATTTFKVGSPMDPRRLHRRRRIPTGEIHSYEVRGSPIFEKYPVIEESSFFDPGRGYPYLEDYVKELVINNSTAIKEVLGTEGMRRDLVKKSIRELLSKAFDISSTTGVPFVRPKLVDLAFNELSDGCRGVFPLWD